MSERKTAWGIWSDPDEWGNEGHDAAFRKAMREDDTELMALKAEVERLKERIKEVGVYSVNARIIAGSLESSLRRVAEWGKPDRAGYVRVSPNGVSLARKALEDASLVRDPLTPASKDSSNDG